MEEIYNQKNITLIKYTKTKEGKDKTLDNVQNKAKLKKTKQMSVVLDRAGIWSWQNFSRISV